MTERSVPPAEVASWLRAHSRPGSLLAAEYDARWHLLTGLPAVHIPYDARTPQKLSAFLETSGVSFVVVEDTALALRPAGHQRHAGVTCVSDLARQRAPLRRG